MSSQMPLPGAWLTCPVCGRRVTVLGQWSPFRRQAVCRDCSHAHPWPMGWVDEGGAWREDAPAEIREQQIVMWEWLQDAAAGCREIAERGLAWGEMPACRQHPRADCPRCGRRVNTGARRYLSWRSEVLPQQLSLPVCRRCGRAHNRHTLGGLVADICERCEAEESVETYFRLRGIFGDADAEAVLDRLYASRPDLFDVGVLPDYWFELERASRTR